MLLLEFVIEEFRWSMLASETANVFKEASVALATEYDKFVGFI